jgi:hypothetical protein
MLFKETEMKVFLLPLAHSHCVSYVVCVSNNAIRDITIVTFALEEMRGETKIIISACFFLASVRNFSSVDLFFLSLSLLFLIQNQFISADMGEWQRETTTKDFLSLSFLSKNKVEEKFS